MGAPHSAVDTRGVKLFSQRSPADPGGAKAGRAFAHLALHAPCSRHPLLSPLVQLRDGVDDGLLAQRDFGVCVIVIRLEQKKQRCDTSGQRVATWSRPMVYRNHSLRAASGVHDASTGPAVVPPIGVLANSAAICSGAAPLAMPHAPLGAAAPTCGQCAHNSHIDGTLNGSEGRGKCLANTQHPVINEQSDLAH